MNTIAETCPTVEDLACFLDGKLAGKERSRVVSHLADCESCYAVFADAARLQLEEAEEEAAAVEAPVIPIRKKLPDPAPAWAGTRARPAWRLPLAAMLLLGTAAIPLYLRYNRMPALVSANLVGPSLVKSDRSTSWSEGDKRGGEEGSEAFSAAELLVGAHLVDLRLAIAKDDARDEKLETQNSLSRINKYIPSFLPVPEEAKFYDHAQDRLGSGERPIELLAEVTQNEESLSRFLAEAESAYLAFGKWTEAGRLSALAESPAFFDDRENRRFLSWLIRNSEDQDLDAEVVASLGEIRNLVEKSVSPTYPYPALAENFKKILEHYQNEADVQSEGFEPSP